MFYLNKITTKESFEALKRSLPEYLDIIEQAITGTENRENDVIAKIRSFV